MFLVIVMIVVGVVYNRPSKVFFGLGAIAVTVAAAISGVLLGPRPLNLDIAHGLRADACPPWVTGEPTRLPRVANLANGPRRATLPITRHTVDVGPDGVVRSIQLRADFDSRGRAVAVAREVADCFRLQAAPTSLARDHVDRSEFVSGVWNVDFDTWNLRAPADGRNEWSYGIRLTLTR